MEKKLKKLFSEVFGGYKQEKSNEESLGELVYYSECSTVVYCLNREDFRMNVRFPLREGYCFESDIVIAFYRAKIFRKLIDQPEFVGKGKAYFLWTKDLEDIFKRHNINSKKSQIKRLGEFAELLNLKKKYRFFKVRSKYKADGINSRKSGYVFFKDYEEKKEEKSEEEKNLIKKTKKIINNKKMDFF